jgi:3',5'-cyclic AMP phosphodiesterase CpdA
MIAASGGLALAANASDLVHLALLSDTHIPADPQNEYRKFLPVENLKLAAAQVAAARPQAALINGDAARLSGEPGDYEALKSLLNPIAGQCPVYIGLGNHDHRENFFKTFGTPEDLAQKVANKHVLAIEYPFLRVLLLDSLLYVNQVAGLLGKAQREWLDRYLATVDGRPTVLFVHHTLGDNDGELLDAEALFRIVRPYAKVKAIFYGHSHQYSVRQQQGLHLVNLPAVGYNFNDKEPVGWVDAFFSPEGVDLTLKAFAGNREHDGAKTSLAWQRV